MIGVASRNANRAESLWSSPRARPAPMTTPSRLIPASNALDCATPMTAASRYSSVRSWRPPSGFAPSRTASSRTSARRRKRSAPSSKKPLTTRKIAASSGFAVSVRNLCSNARPSTPVGIEATISSHTSRSSEVCTRRFANDLNSPLISTTQSRR